MKTTSYKAVRDAVAARMGLDAAVNLLSNQKVVLAEYITSAVRVGWEFFDWPELIRIEERTPVDGVVSLTQVGQTEIGQVLGVFTADPRVDDMQLEMAYVLDVGGLRIPDWDGSSTVWVKFKTVPPEFTATEYAAGTTYAVGDLVFYGKECYRVLSSTTGNAPTNATYWAVQELPYFLAEFVKVQAYAETLAEDGQVDKANYNFSRAEGLLIVAMDNAWLRQGQVRRFSA